MINTDEFGMVTVGGMIDNLFAEYASAGMALARGAILKGYDIDTVRALFALGFRMVMEVLEEEEMK